MAVYIKQPVHKRRLLKTAADLSAIPQCSSEVQSVDSLRSEEMVMDDVLSVLFEDENQVLVSGLKATQACRAHFITHARRHSREQGMLQDAKRAGANGKTSSELVTSSLLGVEAEALADPEARSLTFVDEHQCIGCYNCAMIARNTFFMEDEHGRARVFRQKVATLPGRSCCMAYE